MLLHMGTGTYGNLFAPSGPQPHPAKSRPLKRFLDEYSTSKHAIVVRDVSMVYAIRQETPTGGAERRRTRKTAGPSAIPNRTETAYCSGGDFTRCGSGIQRWSHRALPGSEPQHRRAVRAEVSAFWPAGCLGRVA